MPPPVARFHSHIVDREGDPVEVLRAGEGPPVVLVHASGMGAARWARLAGQWLDRYTVHAPQLVGYGGTGPFDPARWRVADDEAAVERAVEAAAEAGAPVHLVGHSFGGWLALRVARRRPGLLASLAVYEPTVFGLLHAAHDAPGLADLALFDDRLLDPERGVTDALLGAFVDYWNQTDFWQAMSPAQRGALRAVGPKVFVEVRAVLGDRTGPAMWAAIEAPTRVLYGARTTPAAAAAARLLAEAIPDAELIAIERAGHLAPLVRVGPIGAALAAHFARHRPPQLTDRADRGP